VVIAARESNVAGELVEAGGFDTPAEEYRSSIERVVHRFEPDLIHFHGFDFHRYIPGCSVPMMATLHLPVSDYPAEVFAGGIRLVCVSDAQANSSEATRNSSVIPNGVPTRRAPVREPGGYLLWMGRICPEKGTQLALQVARQLDACLIVAGPVHPYEAHQKYFTEEIEPLLDVKRVYAGPVYANEKDELLRGATCVLIPSLVAETSSLVAMESLMCGVPVIAFRAGALPEIVEDHRTGFIADSVEQMVEAVRQIDGISRWECREQARRRFDDGRMIQDYLDFYRSMMTRHLVMG
jgi:glycosyltransferase involved in cell wall biosynthesis